MIMIFFHKRNIIFQKFIKIKISQSLCVWFTTWCDISCVTWYNMCDVWFTRASLGYSRGPPYVLCVHHIFHSRDRTHVIRVKENKIYFVPFFYTYIYDQKFNQTCYSSGVIIHVVQHVIRMMADLISFVQARVLYEE